MKKQFDLQYYLEHPETKVVTRRGYNVRIICTDAMSTAGYNVVGLVSYDGTEKVFKFTPDGLMLGDTQNNYDLFFDTPEPVKKRVPLTYKDLLERVIKGKTMFVNYCGDGMMYCQITNFESEGYVKLDYNEGDDTFESLMEQGCIFVDGDPCWKEVEE